MDLRLGINTGFAINRFPEPDDWVSIVAEELGLNCVQFTADLLNPNLPESLVKRDAERIRSLCDAKRVQLESTFTSQFTRVNHLLHPDAEMRRAWIDWFKRFIDLSAALGAEATGSHFGIMSVRDNANPEQRAERIAQGLDGWRELADYAGEQGLKYLTFEPMSVPREVGATIEETRALLDRSKEGFRVPFLLCLDVDHGDVLSENPDDTDPHAWLREFGPETPQLHIKQSLTDKGGHYPFTPEYNARGKVIPEEIIASLEASGAERCTLLLEISHRERRPAEDQVLADLKASVEHWRPAIDMCHVTDYN